MASAGAFLKKKGGPENDVESARKLVSEAGVAVVPGSSFFRKGPRGRADLLRFCFCKKEETLRAAVERLKRF